MYKQIIKPLLFLFDPEKVHHFVFKFLKVFLNIPGIGWIIKSFYKVENPLLEVKLFGINFPNPVGLAAGFDKDAKLFDELSCFGFGFIEIGTLTPLAQPGNELPRLFRIPDDESLINRMGFNNGGVKEAVSRLKNRKNKLIIGGNIGKNKITPNEKASEDYLKCFEALYDYVDYFVVNVSSPNTPNLRELQDKEPLTELLNRVMALNNSKVKSKPVLLKIAPDLTDSQLDDIIEIVNSTKIQGVIATNTSIDRSNLLSNPLAIEAIGAGGVSGKAVKKRSTQVIQYLAEKSNKSFPIIGVGGIHSPEDALEKLAAGASLIQVYTGFIYEGPALVKEINKAVLKSKKQ